MSFSRPCVLDLYYDLLPRGTMKFCGYVPTYQTARFYTVFSRLNVAMELNLVFGRARWSRGLRPPDCWDYWFESL
jgi:hypothetical protein